MAIFFKKKKNESPAWAVKIRAGKTMVTATVYLAVTHHQASKIAARLEEGGYEAEVAPAPQREGLTAGWVGKPLA